ncbi:NADH dehydrogenase [Sulfitobacter undariae]|uniref:NADH dehydrogenase n=1 Tax=Sulfitobacter undariae TaxID=1563671 RepID=A0A7W6EA33_9RHOB|nr:complex I NDUFA9 subunit family protein [Sulfitobacter undariae]MBB3994064.1 NADH dehydrogenase [Sulfitobacter undariae]
MSKLVTIYGGSGFVGRYIARRMAKAGWRVRVAVRRPNEALFVRTYGVVGQVEPVLCNIRDEASVASVLQGADAVVNCVGMLAENGKNTFEAVQAEGAERIARLAQAAGITRMVHVSAIGADADSESIYAQTKAAGEAGVLKHQPNAMIVRPSIMFGPEDEFFNRFAGMTRMGPVLPVVGADTQFQPVYVDDVAQAVVKGVLDEVRGVYELGGPVVMSMRGLMNLMLGVIRRRRLVLNIPFFAARYMAFGFDMGQILSLGLVKSMVTRDQVKNLRNDNVVTKGAQSFEALGIDPVAMTSVLPEYLWRFRPSGEFTAIKESAQNLRSS